ncbi:MAG: spondin domain-containing protein [Actinomycetota bacterium]
MKRRTRAALAALSLAGLVVFGLPASPATAERASGYRITIQNLISGQPLTPPVVALHRKQVDVFTPGEAASFEVKEIAENGNTQPLVDLLSAQAGVADVFAGEAPIVPRDRQDETGFEDTLTFTLEGGRAARHLSWESMLICTNDGFTGLDGVALPTRAGETVTFFTTGFDSGTEKNTEDFADIVPPCQGLIGVSSGEPGTGTSNPAIATDDVIEVHQGIVGGSDLLPEVHDWIDPVAQVVVTATR